MQEFSKKIIAVVFTINIIVIAAALIMMWRTNDLSPFAYLIPSIAAETATGTGFYYNKAKIENKIKLMNQFNIKPNEYTITEEGDYYNG